MNWLNDNAAAIQAIGSVGAILVAIAVAGWQTCVARCDQKAARRRSARVLAIELLPIMKAIHEDLEVALALGWEEPHHLNIPTLQERRISGADDLERAVDRLSVLDNGTIRPLLGLLSAIRDYHRRLRSADMRELEMGAAVVREVDQRKGSLEAAKRHAAEAVKRLDEVAKV